MWTDAETGRALALPAGIANADVTSAAGDWAVGLAWRPAAGGDEAVPVRWDLRTGAVAVLDAGDPSYQRAEAVSATGDVVMVEWDLSAIALLRDGHAYQLPEPAAEGGSEATGSLDFRGAVVNDSGTVIASTASVHETLAQIPVMWRC